MALRCGSSFTGFQKGWKSLVGRLLILVCVGVVLASESALAQLAKTNRDMREVGDDPRGLAAEVFVQKPLAILAKEMLLESHLDENAKVPRPQRKGLQVEVFTPGDFGILVRYRW